MVVPATQPLWYVHWLRLLELQAVGSSWLMRGVLCVFRCTIRACVSGVIRLLQREAQAFIKLREELTGSTHKNAPMSWEEFHKEMTVFMEHQKGKVGTPSTH